MLNFTQARPIIALICLTTSITTIPNYAESAAEILRRHDRGEAEANITTAVRDFLVLTGLAKASEIVEENPPAQGSRRAVDLTALDTFMEFKRRIGTTGGFNPNPEYVQQIDDYLAQSQAQGRVRMGILTDGKHWLLRWPGAGAVRTTPPYAFTLEDSQRWLPLFEWLRDQALFATEQVAPSRDAIEDHFGPDNPSYKRDIATLKGLYDRYADSGTIRVKRTAVAEPAHGSLGRDRPRPGTDGRPLRTPYLLERRYRYGGAGVLRKRHLSAG